MDTTDINIFKEKAMQWAATFDVCCCLDSNHYPDPYSQYDCLIAVGAADEVRKTTSNAFNELKEFYQLRPNWMFGLLSYELKNETEELKSNYQDQLNFPELYFFIPKYLIALQGDKVSVLIGDHSILDVINEKEITSESSLNSKLTIEARMDQPTYIGTIEKLQNHIKRGDIYEVNFCQEFFAENAGIQPLAVYQALNRLSPTPFSGYFKIYNNYILSATPERFLCKRGSRLISQPIKGTAKRGANPQEDEYNINRLRTSIKEQAENVMIVDLVRNDLTKSALPGTVKVDELFGIYTFPQVHQMISTISCELNPSIHFIDAIKNAFPMGSMTGAPKISAMKLIDNYEKSKGGAFSGSFGCISPTGNFDFNVIIRSILYNEANKYLSFQVGGAITYASNAAQEYEECLLKASAILKILAQ